MKRIGLMTWFSYYNYGSALQVTALSTKIKELGYKSEVINYIPHGQIRTLDDGKIFRYYIEKLNSKVKNRNLNSIEDKDRDLKFKNFLDNNLSFTDLCETKSDLFKLNEKLDAFVCGSDQIWAPIRFNPKYFLDFVSNDRKKIAYAPSIGLEKIEDKFIEKRMASLIEKFNYLSIREEQGKKLIKKICGKEAKVVLDPTLLLNKDEWKNFESPYESNDKYILCYFLGYNEKNWKSVKELAERENLKIKIIPVFDKDYKLGYEVCNGVGPGEFLTLLKNAEVICTDSFHGTIFSINYEKNFYVYERFKNNDKISQNSRINNILKLLNLKNRLITINNENSINNIEINYKEVNNKLNSLRIESLEFLDDSLKKAVENKCFDHIITNTCCGCGICKKVCNHNAIGISLNKSGFNEAIIDKDKCIKCGLCKKVCPFNGHDGEKINKETSNLYSMKSMNEDTLLKSSSGGVAFEISKLYIKSNYNVFGCLYDSNIDRARYDLCNINNEEGLSKFQGSKYIQSILSEEVIDKLLKSDKCVVFGTPCHISGIDSLLKLKGVRENYILVDLICHGVPTNNLWKSYIKFQKESNRMAGNVKVAFRPKEIGWRNKGIRIENKSKKYLNTEKKDEFYSFFDLENCYSDACYECKYRTASSADIRLGDYWGNRFIKDNTGVSMVISLTDRGNEVIKKITNNSILKVEQYDISEYWSVQYPINTIKPVYYEELIEDLSNEELNYVVKKYCLNDKKMRNFRGKVNKFRKIIKI
ncbi:polysaccharide pyruvyl transferase family protein [Clostridium perfringens]|uniref:4Fe-4S binding domain protein n=1 Tax=Clostridium perfringens TaxID=1502 RepID=A0A133MSG4_CLOPF|nr:polysaccharide pyruvyl transferase family protein [Clostridium perfringens]EGT3601060.1 4Fe-4S dicluster domain-containing protein [Clostridium perfringens]KXA06963.1 4Fe-4S binding domain protein [Clostridium perfringens]